jgi:hypothetical protein
MLTTVAISQKSFSPWDRNSSSIHNGIKLIPKPTLHSLKFAEIIK